MSGGDLDEIGWEAGADPAEPAALWRPPQGGWRDRLAARFDHAWLAFCASFERDMEARRGFLWLPVIFGAGTLAYFALPAEPFLPALASVCIMLWLAAWAARAHAARFRLAVAAAMLLSGATAMKLRTDLVAAPMLARSVTGTLSGFVEARVARIGGYRLTVRIRAFDARYAGLVPKRVTVTVRGATAPRVGDGVRMLAQLRPPSGPVLPGGYDFRRAAFYQGIGGTGFAYGHATVVELGVPPLGIRLREPLENLREVIRARVAAFLPGETGRVATSLIIGDAGGLSEKAQDDLRQSGLAHILSVSGLHMVLVSGVVFWVVRALLALIPALALRRPIKKIAAVAALSVCGFYLLISGLDVAAQRSFVMMAITFLAVLGDRRAISLRNIALAGLIVLALSPESILQAGFQMSFAATLALVAGFEALSEWRRRRPPTLRAYGPVIGVARRLGLVAAGLVTTSLLGGLGSTPFALYHFQRMALLSILANVAASPITDFIVMPLSLFAVLLMPFGLDGLLMPWIDRGISAILWIAATVSAWSGDSGGAAMPSVLALLVFVAGFLWIALWKERWRWLGLLPLAIGGVLALAPARPDILVAADGTQVALRQADGRLAILARKPDAFVTDIWLRADGDPRTTRAAGKAGLAGSTNCDPFGCVGSLPDGRKVAWAGDRAALEEDCRIAALVVTPLAAPAGCSRTAMVIDRALLSEGGALAIAVRTEPQPPDPLSRDGPTDAAPQSEAASAREHDPAVVHTADDEDIAPATVPAENAAGDPATAVSGELPGRFDVTTAYPTIRRPWMPAAQ